MGDLSKHFSTDEFRCRCGCGRVRVNPQLVKLLEDARVLTHRPVTIRSGFRCPSHNSAMGGTPQSAHLKGEAADVACLTSARRHALLLVFMALGAKRVGIGWDFLHVDVSGTLPQKVAWLYGSN